MGRDQKSVGRPNSGRFAPWALETELGGYQIVGRLAVGGMAEVYQARPRQSTQRSPGEPEDVVLKRLLPAYRNDGAFVKQFVDEAKLTVRLRHPHIVRTFRCFKAGIDYLMVQELVAGRTLGYMQELLAKSGAAMPPAGRGVRRLLPPQGARLRAPGEGGRQRRHHRPPRREPRQHPPLGRRAR